MKKYLITLATVVAAIGTMLASAPVGYYQQATGLHDEDLMSALSSIIRDHYEVSYSSGLLNAFSIADTDSEGYIIDIYSNCRYRISDSGSSASHLGQGFNREHSFPRSWFGGAIAPMNTDVFHIYPTDIHVNSQRGNDPYGVCARGTRLEYGSYVAKGRSGDCTYPGYTGTVFEPDDEYKGDLARTYFYMVTCYKTELPSWPGSPNLNYSANKYKAFSTWTINMLMEWTRLDPVSEKELKRNDAIYGIQGNRNPFIDHPELAEYIWGDKQGQNWYGDGGTPTPRIISPNNDATFDMGEAIVGTALEYEVYLKGEALNQDLTLTMSDGSHFVADATTFTADVINHGVTLTITFSSEAEGSYSNDITVGSSEASVTFHLVATAKPRGDQPDPVVGDSIIEDWEGCETGGYWTDYVVGHAVAWNFVNAGIWDTDNLKHGENSCRLGKNSDSSIAMAEDYERGASGISLWAGSFNNDADATLNVDYSTDGGATWTTLASITTTRGSLQQYVLPADIVGTVRFRIAQTSGTRVNIDDITIYGQPLVGDVNGDREVNLADVNTLIGIILGDKADAETMRRADVNVDDEINLGDVNALIDIILAI